MVVSRRAADGGADESQAEHEYHHQWRLVYDDVNDGWHLPPSSTADAAASPAPAPATSTCHALRTAWAASPVPSVVPALAFAPAVYPSQQPHTSAAPSVMQSFGDLPAHSMIAVSGTFHFLGR
jgi:hypothetical protein